MTDPRIEIVGQPEPLTGVTVFACRCGMTLSTADYPRFADYEKARKDHRDACPMRFDKPWPFDRLPSLRRTQTPSPALSGEAGAGEGPTPGAANAPVAGLEPRDGVSDLFRSPRVWLGALLGPPAWVVRRWEVGL